MTKQSRSVKRSNLDPRESGFAFYHLRPVHDDHEQHVGVDLGMQDYVYFVKIHACILVISDFVV